MATEAGGDPVASSSTPRVLDYDALLFTPAHSLPLELVRDSLTHLPPSTRLVACANLVLSGKFYDQVVLRRVIELGLEAAQEETELLEGDVRARLEDGPGASSASDWSAWGTDQVVAQTEAVLGTDDTRRAVVRCLAVLQEARRRLDTYDVFAPPRKRMDPLPPEDGKPEAKEKDEDFDISDPWLSASDDDGAIDITDPWASSTASEAPTDPKFKNVPVSDAGDDTPEPELTDPPIDPATFVLQALPLSALTLAASACVAALHKICQRHATELWPYRFSIVEAIPGWVSPVNPNLMQLLPSLGEREDEAPEWPRTRVETETTLLDILAPEYGISSLASLPTELLPEPRPMPISSDALSSWYTLRVMRLDDLGLLDSQIAWVQHGAALGVPGLDAIGEDLSLLSRLIYNANLTPEQLAKWNLATWRRASKDDIVRAYLSNSTADTIVSDIRHFVLPYLYVLESRAERSGQPDPGLVDRMLHDAILDLPLDLALPCFEASQATLRPHQRLIRQDEVAARLALACIYGSDKQDAWVTMSRIFETLPVWEVEDVADDDDPTAATLDAIATFVRPTTASAGPHSARDLFVFFSPLPLASLSRALDILDVHLMSGEMLARWNVPVFPRTLLQASRYRDEQATLAEKMIRRLSLRGADESAWIALWADMCRLHGGGEALTRGAFGLLSHEEMMRMLLGGLLSAGNFAVAKKVIRRLEPEGYFTPWVLEEVVLEKSKEFYMRAETGNIHTGDMKLAYDCLSVISPETAAIRTERDFIQATSRLASFRALSTLTPSEIRHTPNKLDLVRRVLSTSDDAFRHAGIILELTDKLGFRDDPAARAEVLAMLCDAAVAAEEWTLAREHIDTMVAMAEPDLGGDEPPAAATVRDVAWRSCLALGRQSEYPDIVGRMSLLAHAIALCPAADVPTILPLWRAAEALVEAHPEALRRTASGSPAVPTLAPATTSEQRMFGSRRAAAAARMARDFGATFNPLALRGMAASPPISMERHGSAGASTAAYASSAPSRASIASRTSMDSDRDRPVAGLFEDDDGVRAGAKRALVKGVGWLLGAEE